MSLFIVQWGGGPKVTPGQHILTANTRDVLHPIASTRAVHQPIVSTSARRTGQSEQESSARGSAAQGVLARKRKKRSPPAPAHLYTYSVHAAKGQRQTPYAPEFGPLRKRHWSLGHKSTCPKKALGRAEPSWQREEPYLKSQQYDLLWKHT